MVRKSKKVVKTAKKAKVKVETKVSEIEEKPVVVEEVIRCTCGAVIEGSGMCKICGKWY